MSQPIVKTSAAYRVLLVDRIAFCSDACLDNALEWCDAPIVRRTVGESIARVLTCYGCGLHLDEVTR